MVTNIRLSIYIYIFYLYFFCNVEKKKLFRFHEYFSLSETEQLLKKNGSFDTKCTCLTAPVRFSSYFVALKWWHAILNDRIPFGPFGPIYGVTLGVPKKGLKQPQFSNCSISINNCFTVTFSYQNKDLNLLYLMNF